MGEETASKLFIFIVNAISVLINLPISVIHSKGLEVVFLLQYILWLLQSCTRCENESVCYIQSMYYLCEILI
jgi:hypothetical protein